MPPWTLAHDRAVAAGTDTYRDPATGYAVFTEASLIARGTCCGAACRHCPYGHQSVKRRGPRNQGPTWRILPRTATSTVHFWDGVRALSDLEGTVVMRHSGEALIAAVMQQADAAGLAMVTIQPSGGDDAVVLEAIARRVQITEVVDHR